MARGTRKVRVIEEREVPEDPEPEQGGSSEGEPELPPDLEAYQSEFGGSDFTAHIFRLENGKVVHCYRCSPAEVNYDLLASLGTGKYRILVKQGKLIIRNNTVDVDARGYQLKNPEKANGNGVQPMAEVVNILKESQKSTMEMFTAALTAIAGRAASGPPPPSIAELTTAVSNIKKLSDDGHKQPEWKDMVEILKMGIEMGRTGEGGGNGVMDTVIAKVAERFPEILAYLKGGSASNGSDSGTPPASLPVVPSTGADQPSEFAQEFLQNYLALLVNAAAKNRDPNLYAEMVLDFVPEDKIPDVVKIVSRPDLVQYLSQYAPAVAAYPAWVSECARAILELSQKPAEQEPPSEPENAGSEV